ncbi:MAG: FAD-linked oxidase C-terminal domain-containing protein [Myxococcaceae bacterium]
MIPAPPGRRADPAAVRAVAEALAVTFSPGQLARDPDVLAAYGRDESGSGEFPSDLVVFAEKTEHVSRVLRTCQQHGVPVTPVGARSGKSGGSLPLYGGVSLSLERMNQILSISGEDLVAVCQPGVVTGELMRAVEEKGLFYPPDPNSWEWCTLGGNIAENAGGPRALKYGVTRDYVLGLEWVLPDGEVVRVGRRTIKGVAGYDLTGLFVGSEGTLGVATEITLQLIPLPRVVKTALLLFRDVAHAARAVTAVLQGGILPRTLELLDDVAVKAVDGRGFSFPPGTGSAVLAEVDGTDDDAVMAELARLGEICEANGATETLLAEEGRQREQLWAARRVLSTALRALKPQKVSEDIAVPRSRMVEVIERLKQMGAELGLTVATYGHAGDGNLHANILYDGPHERAKVEEAIQRMLRITVEVGGTITGEHGVGHAKRDYLPIEQAPELIALQKRFKALLDPRGLMNPGKMFL